MPKVNRIEKCRKSPGTCGKCGCVIEAGQPYVFWEFRFGGKRVRCVKPECAPKPSDLTQSEFWGPVLALQEQDWDETTIEDLESRAEDVRGELENMQSELDDKLSNMPDGLQQGPTGELIQGRSDALSEAVNALEGIDFSFDEPEKEEKETDEAFNARKQEALEERLQELRDECESALSDISCD